MFFSSFRPVQAHCRSPAGCSFNRFKRSASIQTGPSHAACNIGRDLHFRLDCYRDASLHAGEDLPLNCCSCSAAGGTQSGFEGNLISQRVQRHSRRFCLETCSCRLTMARAFARRVPSATSTTGERSLQPPNPSSSPAPPSLTFWKQEKPTTTTLNSKKKDKRQQQLFAASRMRTSFSPFCSNRRGKGRLCAHPDGTIAVLDQTSAIFSLHNRAAGRGPYSSYGRNLQTCLNRPEQHDRFSLG